MAGGVHGGGGGHAACMAGDMHGGGACMAGRLVWQGVCMVGGRGVHGRRDGHCSGRYTSYWNAFLLFHPFVKSQK